MTNPIGTARAGGTEIPIERTGDVATRTGFRLSWGAVLAGLVIATALQIVLTMFGTAIGLAAYDPGGEKALGIGTGIWAIISLLIALFLGGTTTGWLAGRLSRTGGFLHGTLLWALSTLLTLWLITRGIGAIVGGTLGIVGKTLGVAGSVAGSAASAVATGAASAVGSGVSSAAGALSNPANDSTIRAQLEQTLRQTGDPRLSPESLSVTARRAGNVATNGPADNGTALQDIVNLVKNRASAVNRNDVVNIIMARTGRSRPEAEQLADRVTQAANGVQSQLAQAAQSVQQTAQNAVQTVEQKAPQVANSVASGASTGLWLALLGMGLSLAAAVFGTQRTAPE